MKHLSLASRYRPQTFAQVAGQDMVKAVLSRAAAEDRPAAAYLLSGTRGVGKTTIARIFAKALNCEHAPGPEPCNECAQCRKITQGIHVDVTEIDGASNNSVEDARSLRETIGYAPMEGRYKVFIIDEAHMLTRNAFNALLKTLEEPPERVVFIFATTEAHKFPITIVSRCQHFVFRHLGEDALVEHLSGVLRKEGVSFEESAVRLLARRAAGSVRDSMSLLDQTLALGGAELTAAATRQVLGLAGQEMFGNLFTALHAQDCAAVADLCGQILQQGVDIGFFIRELAGNLRNLFLLRQGGEAMLPSLRLPADEAALWQSIAPRFSTAHLHAAWQMTLDSQRGIVQSPEPAAALELLLLNLAMLPQLLPVGQLTPAQMTPAQMTPAQMGGQASGQPSGQTSGQAQGQSNGQATKQAPDQAQATATASRAASPQPAGQPVGHAAPQPPHAGSEASRNGYAAQNAGRSPARPRDAATAPGPATDGDEAEGSDPAAGSPSRNKNLRTDDSRVSRAPEGAASTPQKPAAPVEDDAPWGDDADGAWGAPPYADADMDDAAGVDASGGIPWDSAGPDSDMAAPAAPAPRTADVAPRPAGDSSRNWQDFYDFCIAEQAAARPAPAPYTLRGIGVQWQDNTLRLQPRTETQLNQLEKQGKALYAALAAFGAADTRVEIVPPKPHRPEAELIAEFSRKEALQPCLEVLNASLKGCRPMES
ncbi:DNA polymerase III subunit gamma/tau [Desulfovibrio sp. 86]|uniref:DNA polymerase III subunit gamma/tau n=1 Tax=uncultured Desulfovibrio sp. TaxID=167968 RepID=A0A212L3R0_9BACT|nr:DNA polymerase III subunit gamma/tau [Desulfovibrio sp. 86]SCM72214.1 DNA polymerase III, subunits gamma and tau [uncultured Desulfovibrio sp.]VZH33369.1 DNA polymerase III subunit gamma/tau [Desulfovibrio sp. 86]